MKQELIKPIIRVGNSAGVLVPKEWLNGKARVQLIDKPVNIKKDVLNILEPYFEEILGIYLTGSYARNEQTSKSDIDIIVITSKKECRIKKNKYDILLISKNEVNKVLKNNALPILPMLKEAKTILNKDYLESIKKLKISKKSFKWNVELMKSSLKMNKELINLKKEHSENIEDSIIYSLILNLRTLHIIDCIKINKRWSNKEFLFLIKEISGSLKVYESYLRIKNDKKIEKLISITDAQKLVSYISLKLKGCERWIKRKG